MKVVVFGGTGQVGGRVVEVLRARGVDAAAAHRSSGVDAYAGTGLDSACADADVALDCTNIGTTKAKVAVDFFGAVAGNIATAAQRAGVRRVVCLSIINAADPAVNAKFGYYQGKAEQERVYRDMLEADSLTVVRSAQWFELAEQLLAAARLGPVALVPHMLTRPLAAEDAAAVLADAVTAPAASDLDVAGPVELDIVDIAKTVARSDGSPRSVFGINVGGRALREGGLLPRGEFVQTETTLESWLARRGERVSP